MNQIEYLITTPQGWSVLLLALIFLALWMIEVKLGKIERNTRDKRKLP